jgi:hypothetical protein
MSQLVRLGLPGKAWQESAVLNEQTICRGGSWGLIGAMYGRRPRCKGKESDFSRNDTGAAMYPASECSRCGCGP